MVSWTKQLCSCPTFLWLGNLLVSERWRSDSSDQHLSPSGLPGTRPASWPCWWTWTSARHTPPASWTSSGSLRSSRTTPHPACWQPAKKNGDVSVILIYPDSKRLTACVHLAVKHVQPVVGHLGHWCVDLLQSGPLEECLKHRGLKNLNELKLSSPLHFKAFELS